MGAKKLANPAYTPRRVNFSEGRQKETRET